ncbi:MAG: hypothetical protein QM771_13915 [Nitrospira sp.]
MRLRCRTRGKQKAKVDMLMKDNQARDKKYPELTGAYAEIPKKLKAYYDSLQDEAIPDPVPRLA